MSETTDEDTGKVSSDSTSMPDAANLLASAEWEERLAQARAQREKVLTAKVSSASRVATTKPAFTKASASEPPPRSGEFVQSDRELAQFDPIVDSVSISAMHATSDAVSASHASVINHPPPYTRRSGLTLLTACAFGIGVGLSLGVVLMAGLQFLTNKPVREATAVGVAPVFTAEPSQPLPTEPTATAASAPAPSPHPDSTAPTRFSLVSTDVGSPPSTPAALSAPVALKTPPAKSQFDAVVADTVLTRFNPVIRTSSGGAPNVSAPALQRVDPAVSLENGVTALGAHTKVRPVTRDASVRTPLTLDAPRFSKPHVPTLAPARSVVLSSLDMNQMTGKISDDTAPRARSDRLDPASDVPRWVPVSFLTGPDGATPAPLDDLPSFSPAPVRVSALTQLGDSLPKHAGEGAADVGSWGTLTSVSPAPVVTLWSPEMARGHTLPFVGAPPARPPSLAEMLQLSGSNTSAVQLFVHAPGSIGTDALDAELDVYADTGFTVADVQREAFKISRTHIRYYSRGDEKVAQALAKHLGVRARDFTRSNAASGRIEIWMKGTAGNRVARTPSKPRVVRQQRAPADPTLQLRNSLILKLRRGDHL